MNESPRFETAPAPRAPTGVEGLDDVLGGGLTAHQLYVIEGFPGSGKTTLALQFLREGARRGESVLHVSLSETAAELHDATYLADAVVPLRYFEARGEIRQAISVVKRRGGAHERTIREFRLEPGGIRLGEPLREFRGVLTGVPVYEGREDTLMAASRT